MKKLIPILLALALAVTSIIAVGTMFTGAEDPVYTVDFKPENLGLSVDNGSFKLGYFASSKGEDNKGVTDFTAKGYYDTVAATVSQFSYYGDMYLYSDSKNPVDESTAKTKAGAVNNDIVLVVNSALRVPFIEFTAPAGGTYSFNMFLSKSATYATTMTQDYLFRAYIGTTELTDYTPGNFKKANAGEPIGSGSNHSNTFTFTVTLTENEKLYLVPDEGNNTSVQGWNLGVEELKATVTALTPVACQHDGEYTYGKTETEHWKICSECDDEIESTRVPHNFDNGDCVCGKEAPDDDTVSVGDVLKPQNLGTSVNNGYFKLGYFASTQSGGKGTTNFASKFYYDTVSSATEQHSYYGQMYTYSDSQNLISDTNANKSKAGAINNDIVLTVDSRARVPFIEFTAPAEGTYTFTMYLSKSATYAELMNADFYFRVYKGESEIKGYTPGNFKKANSSTTIGEGSNHSNVFTFTVALTENEKIYLIPDEGYNASVNGWVLGVEELSATVTAVGACEHNYENGYCSECDLPCYHEDGELYYTVNGDKHTATYDCCGKKEADNVSHDFSIGDCVCGAKKPAPQTGDTVASISVALVIASVMGIALIDKKRRSR